MTNFLKYDPKKTKYNLLVETPEGTYDLMDICESVSWGDDEGVAYGKIDFTLAQKDLPTVNKTTYELLPNGQVVHLYADNEFINWYQIYSVDMKRSTSGNTLSYTAFDRLYNLSNTEESWYYPAGWITSAIMKDMFDRACTELVYKYPSTVHGAYCSKSKSMLDEVSDILDEAFTKVGGHKPVLLMNDGKALITERNWNEYVYVFNEAAMVQDKGNIIDMSMTASVEKLVSRVQMVSKAKTENAVEEVEVKDGHVEFGVFQRVIYTDGDKTKWDLKREAIKMLKEEGEQKITYQIVTVDVPRVRKGHKIKFETATPWFNGYYYVISVSHNVGNRTMTMKIMPESEEEYIDTTLSAEELKEEQDYKKKLEEEEANKNK